MNSVLFVILTDVLPGRQDEQAVGRCGRSGKAGVVQYQLAQKPSDKYPEDAEAVYLQRKVYKDDSEQTDLSSKCNRIIQHCWDGFVLDTFCENLPTYVAQWMIKLFPALVRKKSRPSKPVNPPAAEKDSEKKETGEAGSATDDAADVEDTIATLFSIVAKWFRGYVTQAWAYWRGYGGSRRQPGDSRAQFDVRMGLAPPIDLPSSDSADPLLRFATRFWRFACILRLSGEALYTFAKALLVSEVKLQVEGFCLAVLKQASSPTFEAHGVALTLPPGESPWEPEFSGNAALLYALLSEKPPEGLRRVIAAIELQIHRYCCDNKMMTKTTAEKLSSRDSLTYYHVQREEVVAQLRARKAGLEECLRSGAAVRLKDIATTLRTEPTVAFQAYCLGYGLCEVIFEWYLDSPRGPFSPASAATTEWGNKIKADSQKLGAAPINLSTGGGGSAQVLQKKNEEDKEKGKSSESAGKIILDRLNAKTDTSKQADTQAAAHAASPLHQWESNGPTKNDIQASKSTPTLWQTVSGWLALVWAWLVALLTAPVRRYSRSNDANDKGDAATSAQQRREEAERQSNPIWAYLHSQWDALAKRQTEVNGGLVGSYVGDDAKEIIALVDGMGLLHRQTDVFQEHVEVRTDGTTTKDTSRSEAMAQAKKEAHNSIHLHDENLFQEDMYLINKTLEALKKMAAEQKLEGFDDQLLKMLEAIWQYNEFVQDGKVDAATAAKMAAAMKGLWQSALRFALDHGRQIEDLQTPLDNYNIAKSQSEFKETKKKVVKNVTSFVRQAVKVVKSVFSWIWGWNKTIVKKFVKVPVIREVVEFVTEKVINPVYKAVKSLIDSAKETVGAVISKLAAAVRSTFKVIFEAVSSAVKKIGQMASKAWDWLKEELGDAWAWLKETSFWKVCSELLAKGFEWLASKLVYAFVTFILPVLAWSWKGLTWLWTNVMWPLLAVFEPFVLVALVVLWGMLKAICKYLRYWWQGAGDILQNYVWGTDFDIIDVEKTRSRVSRQLVRLRAALRQVWASSWFQWFPDPSIRIGLDHDSREHVQEQQSRAHDDYLRRERARQQRTAMAFSVLGVLLCLLLVLGAVLSGGLLLPLIIGLVFTTLAAILQYASMDLEADMSISDERKKNIQSGISLAQNIVSIASLVFGMPRVLLQKLADTLRIEQKAKSVLQQIDKILGHLGLGAVVANIRDSFLGMLNNMLDAAGNVLALGMEAARKLQNKQNQEEKQEQQDKQEEVEDESSQKEQQTAVTEKMVERTRNRADGWTFKRLSLMFTASSTDKKSGSEFNLQGAAPSYLFTKEGVESVVITFIHNPETDQLQPHFSRELTAEEKTLFGFGHDVKDLAKTLEVLNALFNTDSAPGVRILSDTTVESTCVTYFNEDGKETKRQLLLGTDQGEVSLLVYPNGKVVVKAQPNGYPKPKPMYLDLNGDASLAKRIRGEVTAEHLQLLASSNLLESDADTLRQVFEDDLNALKALASDNQEKFLHKQEKQDAHGGDRATQPTAPIGSASARGVLTSAWQYVWQAALSYISPIWTLVFHNAAVMCVELDFQHQLWAVAHTHGDDDR